MSKARRQARREQRKQKRKARRGLSPTLTPEQEAVGRENYFDGGATLLAGAERGLELATPVVLSQLKQGDVKRAAIGGAIAFTAGMFLGGTAEEKKQAMSFEDAVTKFGSAKEKEKMLQGVAREQRAIDKRTRAMEKKKGVPQAPIVEMPPDMFAASGAGGSQYGNFMSSKGFV
jgi:hypothetical protein